MPSPRRAALLAAASLLALSACTGGGEEGPGAPSGATTRPASATDTAAPDGGLAGPGASDDGGEAPPVLRPRLLLVTDPPAPELGAEDLAALLGARLGADAECDGPLSLPGGDPQTCGAPPGPEAPGGGEDVVWIAQGVQVPGADGGAAPAVLFTVDVTPSDATSLALGPDRMLSALPMGSMYGAEPVPAAQLGEDALRTLTSQHALTRPVAGYTAVDCTGDLDASVLAPVPCTGAREDGTAVPLWVLPGPFADTDQGLLVSSPAP